MRRPVDAERVRRFMRALAREGRLSFYHYDLCAQVLAKIERGHEQDLADVRQILAQGLVDRGDVLRRFEQIEPDLYRYPAIDPTTFRRALDQALG